MEHRWPRQSSSATFGRRGVTPRVCVAARKQHIRAFLCDALEDLGFITCECAQLGELARILKAQAPDLIVLGLPADGEEVGETLKTLAAKKFEGKILVLGPRDSLMLAAVQEFGEKLGLAMLPVLPTPFGSGNLRESVATLLPVNEPPRLSPVDVPEA